MSDGEVSVLTDMYSFACVLVCMALRRDRPYGRKYDHEVLEREVVTGRLRPELPPSHRWSAVVWACGMLDPRERWSSEKVRSMI